MNVWSNIDALMLMLYQKIISISACSKMYATELFKEIRFPKGKLYEDILTVPKLFLTAKKVSYECQPLLNYRVRKGSITTSAFKLKDTEMLENAVTIKDDVLRMGNPNIDRAARSYIFSKASTLLFLVERSNYTEKRKIMYWCWKYIKKYRWQVLKDCNTRRMNRLGACLSFFGMRFYINVYKKFKR